MHPENCEVYRHSGKFGVHGPLLAFFAAIPIALFLGLAYGYIIKWIPFIYINFFVTVGYGLAFGFGTGMVLKLCKVRNNLVTFLTGLTVGFIALYFDWNGHILAIMPKSEQLPWVFFPGQIYEIMKVLYEEGTWGFRSGGNVTGITLGIVWFVEAAMIVGLATVLPWSMIADTPYCEENQCWLDEEKKIDTLEPIINPDTLEQLQAGNLSVLANVAPKEPGASDFTRVTVKHSPNSSSFFTVRLENVITETDKEGKEQEKTSFLTRQLMLPGPSAEFIKQIERVRSATLNF
jgi:hypothetical protein